MNTRPTLSQRLWRLRSFRNGFLEGDQGWGTFRFVAGLALGFLVVLIGAAIEYFLYTDISPTYLEMTPLIEYFPASLLRYISLVFSLAGLRYLLIPFIPLVVAIIFGARYIQDIYELKSYTFAMRYMLACLFSIEYPLLRINNGKRELKPGEENSLDLIGGPGFVFITPGSAVLFESMTHPSMVLSQGRYFVSRYERISDIVDLTDQHGFIEKKTAMSKDGIMVTVHDIHFRYRTVGGRRLAGVTGRSPQFPYPFSVKAIRNIAYNRQIRKDGLASWSSVVSGRVEGEILNYIRRSRLDDVITGRDGEASVREAIRGEIMGVSFRDRLKDVGAELLWFDIGHFNFEEPQVEEEWINVWAAPWLGKAEVTRAQGDIQRQVHVDLARAEAQAELLSALVDALEKARLEGDLNKEALPKLFLFKVSHVLEGMSRAYLPNPDTE